MVTNQIKSLPPLPISILRIQELCMMDDVEMADLIQVIESDPMLTADILKSVNSPLYGMSKEITSVRQAVMLFGILMVRGFAAATSIKKTVSSDLSPYAITIDRLSETSILQSALVREWYGAVDKTMVPLLASGAFLMELGKLVTSQNLISSGESERFRSEVEQGGSIIELEKLYLGMSSYDTAALMFEHWNFESGLVDMLRSISETSIHPYGQVLYVLQEAISVREGLSEKSLRSAIDAAERMGLDSKALEDALQRVKATSNL